MHPTQICRTLLLTGALALPVALAADEPSWTLPDPWATVHPGAEEAPASCPTTFPDEEGFLARRATVFEGVARQNLESYRRGYFSGGDPGKYLPGHAMAKLVMGVEDPNIHRFMNDNRSYREHYHFASLNWARFLPLFGDSVLTDETQDRLAEAAFRYSAYIQGGGTENHVTQWRTSLPVLPHFLRGGRGLGHQSKEATLRQGKEWLRNWVQGLYAGGQGEWDSSTYMIFTFNGLLNIYDFSPDEEVRAIARAGLEFLAAQYALKYRDGVFTAPNQRGFPRGSHTTHTDETGYLWFGSSLEVTPEMTRGWRYTSHAGTSSWRPNVVLTNLARKDLPELPVTFYNSKPNYWGTNNRPSPSRYHETVYLSRHYSLGSLWNGHGSQINRMQLVAEGENGAHVFHGGHPRRSDHNGQIQNIGYHDGNGRYEQFAQLDSTLILFARSPEKEENPHVFFTLPPNIGEPEQVGDWYFIQAGQTYLALYPLGENVRQEEVMAGRRNPRQAILIDGANAGFVLETSDASRHESLAAFQRAVQNDFVLDVRDAETGVIAVTNLAGRLLEYAFNPAEDLRHGNRPARVRIDGEEMTFGDWPVYRGPYVQQSDGVLRVTDGRQGYAIDFTGDLPVFSSWMP